MLTVNSGSAQNTVKVLTYHDDTLRTGLNPNETILTKANVNSTTFGQIGRLSVIDLVDAEPLYVPNLTINGAVHNVLFVVDRTGRFLPWLCRRTPLATIIIVYMRST